MRYALIILFMFHTTYVYPFCSSPRAPSTPSTYSKPTKPRTPWCVNEYSNTHTCDDWEIMNYNSDIRRYNREVDDYVRELKSYVDSANRFATNAYEYANCEIRDLD
tara:strand:+ start:364 stop:681 length:318 start_codon:yes stop_codon:yes gene_type:complete